MNSREIIKLIIAIIFLFHMTGSISTVEAKERLVLMPLQGTGIDSRYKPMMESAIAKGLFDKYEVLYGRNVEEKVKEIYKKLSEETVAGEECDDTKCMQQIGVEFQAELVATIKVLKNPQGYILVLNIINVLDNELVLSESEPCKGCDEFQVINVLKKMARGKPTSSEPKSKDKTSAEGMVFIKGGCFDMGDTFGDGEDDEKPVHEVCVDDFYMGEHEVTVGEFRDFVNETGYKTEAESGGGCVYYTGSEFQIGRDKYWDNPGFSQTDRSPVTCVSWNDANKLIKWKKRNTGLNYRLPTEAEWEYAARGGGKKVKFSGFSGELEIYKYGNFCDDNCDFNWKTKNQNDGYKYTAPVGSFKPNGIGLYDMSGNVYEWVSDWYGKDYYRNSPKDNPKGPGSGEYRALRGGSWDDKPLHLRAANRFRGLPDERSNSRGGFRIAQD
jgi:formylglycine-generating enzyme required for sulfatase activity